MREIAQLPIRDIITIHSNAVYAMDHGMLGEEFAVRFHDAINHVKKIVAECLKTGEIPLWTIKDRLTNSPFIGLDDSIMMFTKKDFADEGVDYFMQQFRITFETAEIKPEDVVSFLNIAANAMGVKAFRFDEFGAYASIRLEAEKLVPVPDFSNVPESERPVFNPDYFRAVAKLQQEMYYRADYEGKRENLRRFEDDMIKAFVKTRLLLPVQVIEPSSGNPEESSGKKILKKGTEIRIPSVQKEAARDFKSTPVFTHWEELYKMYPKGTPFSEGLVVSPNDLLSAPEEVLIVNPGSLSFGLCELPNAKAIGLPASQMGSYQRSPVKSLQRNHSPQDSELSVPERLTNLCR